MSYLLYLIGPDLFLNQLVEFTITYNFIFYYLKFLGRVYNRKHLPFKTWCWRRALKYEYLGQNKEKSVSEDKRKNDCCRKKKKVDRTGPREK